LLDARAGTLERILSYETGKRPQVAYLIEAEPRAARPGGSLLRDNLDENRQRQSEFEVAAGSEVMIHVSRAVRKHFS
jgi:hypothetical protein